MLTSQNVSGVQLFLSTSPTLQQPTALAVEKKKEQNSRKVKITNLKYTTTVETLREECLNFGPLAEVNLLMDENNDKLNKGRAYVLFETPEAAAECVKQLHRVPVRL